MTELETILTAMAIGAVLAIGVLHAGARAIRSGEHRADEAAERRRWQHSTRIEERNRRTDLRYAQDAENSPPTRPGRAHRAIAAHEQQAESAGGLGVAEQPMAPPPLPGPGPGPGVDAGAGAGLPLLSTEDRAAFERDLHRLNGDDPR